MADDIRVNIEIRKEREAAAKLNMVSAAATKAGDQFDELSEQITDAGKSTDKAGGKFKDGADDVGFLDKQIKQTTGSLKGLIAQLDRTGDTSLLKDIGKERRDLRRFTSLAKEIAEPAKEAGVSLVQKLAEGFKTGSAALKGAAVPVVLGAVAALAPAIGATINAAILTGVGSAGIGAGIALAFQKPVIKEAAGRLGEDLKEAFAGSADQFLGPLLSSFEILGDAGRQFAANLKLNELAPLVTTLAKGFAGLGQNLLPGLNKALVASKPILRVLANELPELGSAISDFLSSLSDESDGAAMALSGLLRFIGGTIRGAGEVIGALTGIFEWSVRAAASASGFLEDVLGWVPILGDHIQGSNDDLEAMIDALKRGEDASGDFSGGVDTIGESAEETKQKIEDLTSGIEALFGRTIGLDQATLAYKNGMVSLTEALTDGKRTLDDNTQAGRDNIDAVLDQIRNVESLRQANIENGMAVGDANRKYEAHIEGLRKTLLNLGYNKTAVNELIDRYKNIPKKIETSISVVLTTHGSATAWSMLRSQERQQEGRATGGNVRGGRTYWVGENGPELVTFGEDGYVHNAAQSQAMMSGASGGSTARAWAGAGAEPIRIALTIRGDGPVTEAIAGNMRLDIAQTAGGSAEVYFA